MYISVHWQCVQKNTEKQSRSKTGKKVEEREKKGFRRQGTNKKREEGKERRGGRD